MTTPSTRSCNWFLGGMLLFVLVSLHMPRGGGSDQPPTPQKPGEPGLIVQVEKLMVRVEKLERNQAQVEWRDGSGILTAGELQICWGRVNLPAGEGSNAHVRTFKFTFPRQFASTPAVTTGFNPSTSGYVIGIYNSTISETDFSGAAYDPRFSQDNVPESWRTARVEMSYVAIGKRK